MGPWKHGMIGVYGANGFLGRSLLQRLSNLQRPVRAISRVFDPELRRCLSGGVEFVEADFEDSSATFKSLQGLDAVVQLVSGSSPASYERCSTLAMRQNVMPHLAFMQAAIDTGIRRYVFASSGGTVYGPQAATPTPEDAPTIPICLHGLDKLTIEHHLRMHALVDGLEVMILRIANAYGPGQAVRKGQGLIPAVLDRVARGLPAQVLGDGTAERDYVFVDDVVDAFWAALELPSTGCGVFNIGSGRGRTVIDVIKAIQQEIGMPIARIHVPARRTDVTRSVLEVAKAERELGWQPQTEFQEGLRSTIDWWRTAHRGTLRRAAA
jgi:UDP-glucose 4-epimerase